jgi:hypothetical protein
VAEKLNPGGLNRFAASITPTWKYKHSEQKVSQLSLQRQSFVFDLALASFSCAPEALEHPASSVAGAQQSASHARYMTPPNPGDQDITRAIRTHLLTIARILMVLVD